MHGSRDLQGAPDVRTVSPAWAVGVRTFAFLRKEVVEIVRQPRLIALLVIGPFLLLVMFGMGYGETTIQKRAIFVGPADSIYADVLETYEEELSDFIDSAGLVPTLGEGRAALTDGDVDVVVVFPDDPEQTVMSGERAVIEIYHDEIDPIQQGAVEIAARLAIQEVNATVLTSLAAETQDQLATAGALSDEFAAAADGLTSDPVASRDMLQMSLQRLAPALDGTATVLGRLDGTDEDALEQVEATRARAAELAERAEAIDESTSDAELQQFSDDLADFADQVDDTVVLDPEVLVRPFRSHTENVVSASINPTDYFTPASLALLLQHLALTFAALSLVRDRRTGLFELMRVGPLSSIEIIVGKIFAYLLVGSVVGAALVAAATLGLGVELAGSIGWLAVVVVGVLLASLAMGMVLAIISKTESQAVQFAMLALLAGLFFSGFILPISGLSYPVKVISWLLPVTYGISMLQDIMLRGLDPDPQMLLALGGLVVAYGAIAIVGLRRRLRTSET
jgi:ABC-2 type transport system permease protein